MDSRGQDRPDTKVVAIVQARLGSYRFPRKVLREVKGEPLLSLLLRRLMRAETLDEVVLAIPEGSENDELADLASNTGVGVYRGSESDVLSRYYGAAQAFSADVVVRVTGDCPLIDWEIVDRCVSPVLNGLVDHSLTSEEYPDGLDVEVFRAHLLREAHEFASQSYDREHVTPYIRRISGRDCLVISPENKLEDVRITLDTEDDLTVIVSVIEEFRDDWFLIADINSLAIENPSIFLANKHLARNEGSKMTSGQKMWQRAKKSVAGGNMLLSKRPDMHSPGKWPAYFSRAKGCRIWDLDDREYIDVGFMGIGTNILGYGHEPVDQAARHAIENGNLSTLNAPEEVMLAERLLELHPWAEMARFTRSGGEAGAVAVRLARAATGKERIVFCGYHGWHDWYLAANLADDGALDDHLLPGLSSAGVPRGLTGTAIPFTFNDIDSLRAAVSGGNVAAIYMEVERTITPQPGFLEQVRKIASELGAVLIFDECTSGFRRNLGGIHMFHGVVPDVAVFGKTLGNGYAINAVLGIRDVMDAASRTFISSTFWTERIGPSAALAALSEMERLNAPQRIHDVGLRVRDIWATAAKELGLPLLIRGIPSLSTFAIEGVEAPELKTILTNLFLERGFLGGPAFYASLPHEELLESVYEPVVFDVLEVFATHLQRGTTEALLLDGVAKSGFARLA